MDNILPTEWLQFDHTEVSSILSAYFGRSRQDASTAVEYYFDPDVGAVVDLGAQAQLPTFITLEYGKSKSRSMISAVRKGPAYTNGRWREVRTHVEDALSPENSSVVVRHWAFSVYPVTGGWHSDMAGLGIHPAPPDWPRPPLEGAPNPFVIEVRVPSVKSKLVTNIRRGQAIGRIVRLLNLLLEGAITEEARRHSARWAIDEKGRGLWAQDGYRVPDGFVGQAADLSEPAGAPLDLVDPAEYWARPGGLLPNRVLELPSDLEASLERHRTLAPSLRADLDRALYWLSVARRLWNTSESMYFLALATAIETLMPDADGRMCETCGQEAYSVAARFRDFLLKFGNAEKATADNLYELRSALSHGTLLLDGDEDSAWGLTRLSSEHRAAIGQLTGDAPRAIRGFLQAATAPQ